MSLGMEMVVKAAMTQLMAKLDLDKDQVNAYKQLVENFFKSHQLLIESHQELRTNLERKTARFELDHARINDLYSLHARLVKLLEGNSFKCQNCGAEHVYANEENDGGEHTGQSEPSN